MKLISRFQDFKISYVVTLVQSLKLLITKVPGETALLRRTVQPRSAKKRLLYIEERKAVSGQHE